MFGISREAAANLACLDEDTLQRLDSAIRGNRDLRWKVVQRGFWAHGVHNLRDDLREAESFTMDGAEQIRCPTLLTVAQRDSLGAFAESFFAALHCPKALLRFSAAEGAGDHCEMQNRSALNRRVLDWLDEQFFE